MRRTSFALATALLICAMWVCISQIIAFRESEELLAIWTLLFLASGLAFTWGLIALGVKRLHDIGISGWFIVLMFITGLYLIAWVGLSAWPGEAEENIYGPPPVS